MEKQMSKNMCYIHSNYEVKFLLHFKDGMGAPKGWKRILSLLGVRLTQEESNLDNLDSVSRIVKQYKTRGYSSVEKCLPNMWEALDLIPSTAKKKMLELQRLSFMDGLKPL